MSLLPAFRAHIDKNLSDDECRRLVDDVKKLKGVLSVSFGRVAQTGEGRMNVTYTGAGVEGKVRQMKGVTRISPLL